MGMSATSTPIQADDFGDFDSPVLKRLRETWNNFLEESSGPREVIRAINWAQQQVDQHINKLQRQVDSGVSDPLSQTFQTIARAFVEHLNALQLMRKEFRYPPGSPLYQNFFEQGYERAQEATNQMVQAHQNKLQHIQQKGWVNCPLCGTRNQRSDHHCAGCRKSVPEIVALLSSARARQSFTPVPSEQTELTQVYLQVRSAALEWLCGKNTMDNLLAVLDQVFHRLENRLATLEEQFSRLPVGTSEGEASRVALLQSQEGIESALYCLEELERASLQDPPRPGLVRLRLQELEAVARNMQKADPNS